MSCINKTRVYGTKIVVPAMVALMTLHPMGLLPDTKNCGLRIRREYRERFPRHARAVMHTGIAN